MRRLFAVLAVVGLLAACSDGDDDPTSASTTSTIPAPDTVLRVAVEDWPACVNPLTCASDALHGQVLQHVLPVAFELDAAGEYQPSVLLDSTPTPERNDDGELVIRYEIDPEARWADGRPITSSDFRGTWQAIMATPEAAKTGYDRIVSVDDRDPLVAVVTLAGPVVDWQALFGGARGFVLQADAFGPDTDLTGQFVDELPFAAGPYQLLRWDDDGAILSATEPWESAEVPSADQVQLDRITVGQTNDPRTYDVIVPSDGGTAPDTPAGFDARTTPTTTVLGIWLDRRNPLLESLVHRQSIDALLDRDALLEAAGADDLVTCPGWVPDIGPWCEAGRAAPADADVELARFVLFSEGWQADESGTLVRGGEAFVVPVSHDPDDEVAGEVASEIASQLGNIGIGTTMADLAQGDWRSRRPSDEGTGIGVFAIDLGVSPRVDDVYGCPAGVESSVFGACPEALLALVGELGTAPRDEALELVGAIAQNVSADKVWFPLVRTEARSYFRSGRVQPPDDVAASGGPLADLHRFVVDD